MKVRPWPIRKKLNAEARDKALESRLLHAVLRRLNELLRSSSFVIKVEVEYITATDENHHEVTYPQIKMPQCLTRGENWWKGKTK